MTLWTVDEIHLLISTFHEEQISSKLMYKHWFRQFRRICARLEKRGQKYVWHIHSRNFNKFHTLGQQKICSKYKQERKTLTS